MSLWRRQAGETLPELWHDADARQTPYSFFFELLPFVRDAHRQKDDDALRRAYGFARWCFRQGGDLQNAAGVAFYEHLFDAWDVHEDVLRWLEPDVVRSTMTLWEDRLQPEQLAVVRSGGLRLGARGRPSAAPRAGAHTSRR